MTLTNAQWKCIFSWKDCSNMRWDQDLLRDTNCIEWTFDVNIEFMEAIWAIWFWPAGVKTQTNEIISSNDERFYRKNIFAQY